MPVLSTLLRLTLSAILVLNGVGTALAGTRMQLEHGMHARHAAQATEPVVDAKAERPCHHQHAAAAPAQVEAPVAPTATPEKSKTPAPDCCKSGSCGCACMYTVAGVVVIPLLHAVPGPHAAMTWAETSGHRPPSLPHLIRPPIG